MGASMTSQEVIEFKPLNDLQYFIPCRHPPQAEPNCPQSCLFRNSHSLLNRRQGGFAGMACGPGGGGDTIQAIQDRTSHLTTETHVKGVRQTHLRMAVQNYIVTESLLELLEEKIPQKAHLSIHEIRRDLARLTKLHGEKHAFCDRSSPTFVPRTMDKRFELRPFTNLKRSQPFRRV